MTNDKPKKEEWKLVGEWPSQTEQGVVHEVHKNEAGEVKCSCRGFKYRGTCRHLWGFQERIDG